MRVAFLGIGLVAGLLIPNSAAFAQYTGTHIGRNAGTEDGLLIYQLMTKCVADRQPGRSAMWLNSLPGSPDEEKIISKLDDDLSFCMTEEPTLNTLGLVFTSRRREMRRGVAIAHLHFTYPNLPTSIGVDPNGQPWFMSKLAALPSDAVVDKEELAVDDFGHCVVTSHWAETRAFLASKANSPQEKDTLQALVPFLGSCLTANAKVQFDAPALRGIFCEAAFHVLRGQAVSQ